MNTINPQQWLTEHGDILYRYALARCKDSELASDLVQETLLSAWKNHQTFSGDSTVRTWLIGILKHKWIDYLRKEIRTRNYATLAEDDPTAWFDHNQGSWKEQPTQWHDNPENLCSNEQFLSILHTCVEHLPAKQALVFDMRELQGLSAQDVCKVCDISTTNLHVLLHRARLSLRSCLDTHWFGK